MKLFLLLFSILIISGCLAQQDARKDYVLKKSDNLILSSIGKPILFDNKEIAALDIKEDYVSFKVFDILNRYEIKDIVDNPASVLIQVNAGESATSGGIKITVNKVERAGQDMIAYVTFESVIQ
ncbi:MAG: hypothetical protein QMD97_01590 [Candidatus Aenigmarchaeota archaeon]|nr:hypothetical protein [Candidatus Aenigmarchaeota archaeon]